MGHPESQTRSFPSMEVDSKSSYVIRPKIQGRCRPGKKRRTRFSYHHPDPETDCGSLVVSGVCTLSGSMTSSTTADSHDDVSSYENPSSGRRLPTRYISLLVQATKDVGERLKKPSQANNHDNRDTTSDEREHSHDSSIESPLSQLTLIAELKVAKRPLHELIDDFHTTSSSEAEGVCDGFATLLPLINKEVVNSGLNAFAEMDALKCNERLTLHFATAPQKSQSIDHLTGDAAVCTDRDNAASVDDCKLRWHTSIINIAARRKARQARDSESLTQPRFSTLCITFNGLTNEEVEVSFSPTGVPTLDTMPQTLEMIEDPVAPLTQQRNRSQALWKLRNRITWIINARSSTRRTLVAPDVREKALTKPTYQPARMCIETDTQPFDEPRVH